MLTRGLREKSEGGSNWVKVRQKCGVVDESGLGLERRKRHAILCFGNKGYETGQRGNRASRDPWHGLGFPI